MNGFFSEFWTLIVALINNNFHPIQYEILVNKRVFFILRKNLLKPANYILLLEISAVICMCKIISYLHLRQLLYLLNVFCKLDHCRASYKTLRLFVVSWIIFKNMQMNPVKKRTFLCISAFDTRVSGKICFTMIWKPFGGCQCKSYMVY